MCCNILERAIKFMVSIVLVLLFLIMCMFLVNINDIEFPEKLGRGVESYTAAVDLLKLSNSVHFYP